MPSQFVHLQQLFAFSKRAFQSAETPEKVADITYCLGNPQGSSIRNLNLFQKAKTKDNQLTMGLVRLFLCCFLWKIPSIDSWHQRHRDLERQLRWQWCDHWVLIRRYHTFTSLFKPNWSNDWLVFWWELNPKMPIFLRDFVPFKETLFDYYQ